MRVLVACEFSGIVRDAFVARGHDAVSVDLLPSERPGPHIEDDAVKMAYMLDDVDLLIAHPPCTYLANSGVRWLHGGKGATLDDDRYARMIEAASFFSRLLEAPVPRIAIENPVMHGMGREAIHDMCGGPDVVQTIQPWMFGHGETKATCLWLKGLPPLVPTNIVDGRTPRVHHARPGRDRWKERSRTLQGIADAMADQWGSLATGGGQEGAGR